VAMLLPGHCFMVAKVCCGMVGMIAGCQSIAMWLQVYFQ